MKKHMLALAIVLAPLSANASELGYTHVELGYTKGYFDNLLDDGDIAPRGGYLNGSIELGKTPFHLFGGYRQGGDSESLNLYESNSSYHANYDYDIKQYHVGVGFRHEFNDQLNLLVETSYHYAKHNLELNARQVTNGVSEAIEIPDVRFNADDLRVGVGVDALLAPALEGWAKVHFTKGDSTESGNGNNNGDFGGTVGMQYKFNPTWGVTGQVEYSSDVTVYGVGVRASF